MASSALITLFSELLKFSKVVSFPKTEFFEGKIENF
jgi:hypothetical protein